FHTPPSPDFYTLSLHDALPICPGHGRRPTRPPRRRRLLHRHPYLSDLHPAMTLPSLLLRNLLFHWRGNSAVLLGVLVGSTVLTRSEEHTSELQSRSDLVCRLLL